jgi:hypothetical protein
MQVGDKVKDAVAKEIVEKLKSFLPPDEKIIGIYRANNIIPLLNEVVITSARIIGVTTKDLSGNTKFAKELMGTDIASVTVGDSKKYAIYIPITITDKYGKSSKYADIYKTNVEEAAELLKKIIGKTTDVSVIAKQSAKKTADKLAQKERAAQVKREQSQLRADAVQLSIDRANSGKCPKCGSDNIQGMHSSTQKGFSDANACGGCCLLGPLGLLCGLCGSGKKEEKTFRMCLNCGNKF